MYKRICILVSIALALASCTKEETVRDVAVQFNAAVSPEMAVLVRGGEAESESVIANHAVLQAWQDNNVLAAKVEQSITPGTTQISFGGVRLVEGEKYDIYIWVGCAGYYNVGDLRTVSLAEGKGFDGKSLEFDAFFAHTDVTCSKDEVIHQVTLKRPFAKVSFSAPVDSVTKISFTAPTGLDLRTGKVLSDIKDFEYTVQPEISTMTAFDYIFADEGVTDMDYTFKLGEDEAKTTTIPVSRNRKTNIIYKVTE